MKTLLLIFMSTICFAQINQSRKKGSVFKSHPEKPYENLNYTGLVVVTKGMYGLTFEDKELPSEVKNRIEKFFKHRLNGYVSLKKYHLYIYKKNNKWYIDNNEF